MTERTAAAAALLPVLLIGCFPYEQVDIRVGQQLYRGTILTRYTDVEVSRSAIRLKPGARFAVETSVTQFLSQLDVAIVEGRGMNIYLRTVPHGLDSTSGIRFRYAVDGCSVRMPGGETIPVPYNAGTEQQLLAIYNEASLLSVSAGCDRLFEQFSDLPATTYVIFETLPESTVEIRSMIYFDIDPNQFYDID